MNSPLKDFWNRDARGSAEVWHPPTVCQSARKLPHIILLHDELSFDITVAPGIKVPIRLSASLPLVRRQVAQASRGGRRRTELVHGV